MYFKTAASGDSDVLEHIAGIAASLLNQVS